MNLLNWVPTVVFSSIILIGFILISWTLLTTPIPIESKDIAMIIFGSYNTLVTIIVGVWVKTLLNGKEDSK